MSWENVRDEYGVKKDNCYLCKEYGKEVKGYYSEYFNRYLCEDCFPFAITVRLLYLESNPRPDDRIYKIVQDFNRQDAFRQEIRE